MRKIAVVVPVLSQFQYAIDALESVRTIGVWTPFIIPNYRSKNGVAVSWNLGTKQAIFEGYTHILIINDDIVIAPYTVDHMANVLDDHPEFGLVTGSDHRNTMSPDQVREMPFPDYEIDIIDAPDFACFMVTPESYNAVGEFDENFTPAYFEDDDYVYRCLLADRQPVRSQRAAFYHYGSQTQNKTSGKPVVPPPQFVKNRQYYVSKWGGEPGSERFTTPFNKE